jgi:uncharacterized RDD family membrane protein YckC
MPLATTTTTTAPPPTPADHAALKPAGFGIRLVAHLIDFTILSIILFPILIALLWDTIMEQVSSGVASAGDVDLPLAAHIFLNVPPIIAVILLWHWLSATPGKMLCKLKIVDSASLGRPSWRQCFLRFLGYLPPMIPLTILSWPLIVPGGAFHPIASLITLPLLIGFLSIAWDPCKQGWHDKLANTLVVSTKLP